MYGSDFISLIVGIVLLVINICIIVKFFQIAKNVEKLTNLYVNGIREIYNTGVVKYYKLPLEERTIEEDKENTKAEDEKREELNRLAEKYAFHPGLK